MEEGEGVGSESRRLLAFSYHPLPEHTQTGQLFSDVALILGAGGAPPFAECLVEGCEHGVCIEVCRCDSEPSVELPFFERSVFVGVVFVGDDSRTKSGFDGEDSLPFA